MIYASSSIIVNTSANAMWNILEEFIQLPKQGNYITNCTKQEDFYNGFLRSLSMPNEANITEKVLLLKDQYKITMRLENHPLYIGDTIYQIISSDQEQLSDKRVTLCAALSWRIRPGIIEAPAMVSKQIIIDDLLKSISDIAEKKWL